MCAFVDVKLMHVSSHEPRMADWLVKWQWWTAWWKPIFIVNQLTIHWTPLPITLRNIYLRAYDMLCGCVRSYSHMYVSYKLNPWSWSCRWFCCDDYVLPILLFVIFSMIPQLQWWCVNFMFSYLEIIYEKALCVCSRIHGTVLRICYGRAS